MQQMVLPPRDTSVLKGKDGILKQVVREYERLKTIMVNIPSNDGYLQLGIMVQLMTKRSLRIQIMIHLSTKAAAPMNAFKRFPHINPALKRCITITQMALQMLKMSLHLRWKMVAGSCKI